ncbi:MAG: hypothetical protein FP827_09350 [Candidatus Omnitrophica bacterium]|nr:hypothetical protein [Candidatus Omnitrophota bacterium]
MEAGMSRIDAVFRIKKAGLAFGSFSYEQSFPIVNYDGSSYSGFSQYGEIASLSAGYPVLKNLSVGVGLRNVNERFFVADSNSYEDSVSCADMGMFFRHRGFRAAWRAANFGEAKIWGDEALPSYGGVSIGYSGDRLKAGISVGADQLTGISRFGAEYALNRWLSLRLGLESYDEVDASHSFGFTVSYGAFAFDFATAAQADLGSRVMTALRYNWGRKKLSKVESAAPRAEKAPARIEKAAPAAPQQQSPAPSALERRKRRLPAEIESFDGKPAEKAKLPEVPEGERINIAVTDFEARAPLSQSEAAFISDFVRSDIVKTGRFNVIEKNNMDKVLAEQGFQQTGCSSAECAVAIGKVLNVKFMAVGSCGQLLGKYIITMNIVDVQSAKIIFSDDVSVANPDDLRNKITELIGNFLGSLK